jgi:hypothetical protein
MKIQRIVCIWKVRRRRAAWLALATAALGLAGCSSISGTRELPDGSRLRISANRLFWASEGVETTVADTNGLRFTLSVQKSSVDSAALSAVAAGVAQGIAAGATGVK